MQLGDRAEIDGEGEFDLLTETSEETGADIRFFDLSYAHGGTRFEPFRWQVGRFLHNDMPEFGILEDPATGSAVASFAGYLAAHGGYADGTHVVPIEQGYEMGRPSQIELTIRIARGALESATIAGYAVTVMEGTI